MRARTTGRVRVVLTVAAALALSTPGVALAGAPAPEDAARPGALSAPAVDCDPFVPPPGQAPKGPPCPSGPVQHANPAPPPACDPFIPPPGRPPAGPPCP